MFNTLNGLVRVVYGIFANFHIFFHFRPEDYTILEVAPADEETTAVSLCKT